MSIHQFVIPSMILLLLHVSFLISIMINHTMQKMSFNVIHNHDDGISDESRRL